MLERVDDGVDLGRFGQTLLDQQRLQGFDPQLHVGGRVCVIVVVCTVWVSVGHGFTSRRGIAEPLLMR